MEPNKTNPYQGTQGQQGAQSQQGNQRGQNLTDEDRRRGGQQSAQSQQRSQQGQFAGRPNQGNQGQASPGRNTEDEKRMEDEGGNQAGNKADQNKNNSGGCGCNE